MENWNIGINNNGGSEAKQDALRRGKKAQEFTEKLLQGALIDTLTNSMKLSPEAKKKYRYENIQYAGAAIEFMRLWDESIPQAMEELIRSRGDVTEDEQRWLKTIVMTNVIKAIVEGGDKLRSM